MILFHSGDGFGWAQPEILLGEEANLMLTYADQCGRQPDPRFRAIYQARKEAYLAKMKDKTREEEEKVKKEEENGIGFGTY